jgi:hypothetical protein
VIRIPLFEYPPAATLSISLNVHLISSMPFALFPFSLPEPETWMFLIFKYLHLLAIIAAESPDSMIALPFP